MSAAAPRLPPPELPPLRDVIRRHGLDARRSLGQHFLGAFDGLRPSSSA